MRNFFGDNKLFLLPLLAMLLFLFVLPIGSFLFKTINESNLSFYQQITSILLSPSIAYVIWNTIVISLAVTLTVLIVAYPISYVMTFSKKIAFTLILICIVIPYFTSVVVRTYSWMVILGQNGVLNQFLLHFGIINEPLKLMYTRFSVIVGMVYVLLPYLVLTLFASMKGVDLSLLRAAHGMGASNTYTFFRIFLPLTVPGVISGSLIVFILSAGFFITPALMGGNKDVMIAMLIQREIEFNLNWPVAAILSLGLLVVTLTLYSLYYRFTNLQRMLGQS